jgi:hypothetical protein
MDWLPHTKSSGAQFVNGQRGPGLALFLRGGMRGLMNACSFCAAPSTTKGPVVASEDTVLARGMRAEVVLILAGILLHSCQESRS